MGKFLWLAPKNATLTSVNAGIDDWEWWGKRNVSIWNAGREGSHPGNLMQEEERNGTNSAGRGIFDCCP